MHITYKAADVSQVDTMDAYLIYRGLNGFKQGLVDWQQWLQVPSGFHFVFNEGLQFIEWKNSNHIMLESVKTDTRACGICRFKWREGKSVIKFLDDCINVNTTIIDVFRTLEHSNSSNS
jgi:hypothetical protein